MKGGGRETGRSRVVGTLDVPHRDNRLPTHSRRVHSPRGVMQLYEEPSVAGRTELLDVAWLRLARITAAARHKVIHEPQAASGPAAALVLQISGKSVIKQRGRTAQLAPGQWCLADPSLAYTLISPGASRRIVLLIPGNRLAGGYDIECLTGRSFSGTLGVGRLVFGICSRLVEEFTAIRAECMDLLAVAVTRIVNFAIQEMAVNPADELLSGTIENRVRTYVSEHLRDPHLSTANIAAHFKLSIRSLHRAMRGSSRSVHGLIWHERLERCRRDLLDPAGARRRIAEIAYSWGFKNVTHFSQAFRAKYGISARDERASILKLRSRGEGR